MSHTLQIKIYDTSTQQWLADGGTFTTSKNKAKNFDSILKATDGARRSGIKDEDVDADWGLINTE